MYRLHHHPFSQHARRVVALLEEARLPYALVHVALEEREHHSSRFLALNPNHQIPVLEDGDFRLAESNAILRYLCLKHELWDLYPHEPVARARVEQWLDWNQCRLGPNVTDVVLNGVFLGPRGDEAAIARGRAGVDDAAPALAETLWELPFVAGERVTIADVSIDSNLTQLALAGAAPVAEPILAWRARMAEVYGVRRSCAAMEAMMAPA